MVYGPIGMLPLLAAQKGALAGGVQKAHSPAQPHRGADPRHPQHGGVRRVLSRHFSAGRGGQRGGQRLQQGAACRAHPHLRSGGYPRRQGRDDR